MYFLHSSVLNSTYGDSTVYRKSKVRRKTKKKKRIVSHVIKLRSVQCLNIINFKLENRFVYLFISELRVYDRKLVIAKRLSVRGILEQRSFRRLELLIPLSLSRRMYQCVTEFEWFFSTLRSIWLSSSRFPIKRTTCTYAHIYGLFFLYFCCVWQVKHSTYCDYLHSIILLGEKCCDISAKWGRNDSIGEDVNDRYTAIYFRQAEV